MLTALADDESQRSVGELSQLPGYVPRHHKNPNEKQKRTPTHANERIGDWEATLTEKAPPPRLLYGYMFDGRAMFARSAIGSRRRPGSVAGVKCRLHEMLPELALVVPVVQVNIVRDVD